MSMDIFFTFFKVIFSQPGLRQREKHIVDENI